MLFNHNIKNIKDWAGIFQDKTAFAPLVKEIFRRHGLDFTGIDSCTPGSNAVFRSGGFIVKIFAPEESEIGGENDFLTERFGLRRAEQLGVPAPGLYAEGVIRAIGISNFYTDRMIDIANFARIKPMVNQIELHPFYHQDAAIRTMCGLEVCPQAWAPLCEGMRNIFSNKTLEKIGKKYGKSAAQVALRWNVQRGVVVIPKSVHKDRMEQNMNIWDFELSEEDMNEIAKLDIGHSEIVNHDDPNFVKMLHGLKVHE